MRQYLFPVILSFLLFSLTGCEEITPEIPVLGPQTLGDRKVLIEEFTGVRCPNCPEGAAEIENLIALYGENVVAISIHSSGSFAVPLPDSKFDFRTEQGDQLLDLLGIPLGYPSAVVNRIAPAGAVRLQQGKAAWAGLIETVLAQPPSMNITLDQTYEEANRTLTVQVGVLPNQAFQESVALSVVLVENNVADPQISPQGLESDYVHQHVFRGMLSPFNGLTLQAPVEKGALKSFSFQQNIPTDWIVNEMGVIAFVHRVGDNKEVLQVEELKFR